MLMFLWSGSEMQAHLMQAALDRCHKVFELIYGEGPGDYP